MEKEINHCTVRYSFNALNEIKPEMIAEANANAPLAAEQFAISDRDENTPYIKTVRVVTSVDYQLKN